MHKAQGRREPEEKIEYFTRAIRTWRPTHSRTLLANCHFGRGEAHYRQAEFALAQADIAEAAKLDSGAPRARLLHGKILLRLREPRKAAREFEEYRGMTDEWEGELLLGLAHERAGHYQSAEQNYRKALEKNPQDFRPAVGLGRVMRHKKKSRQALDWASQAEGLSPKPRPDVLELKAQAEEDLGFIEKALKDMDQSVALYRENLESLKRGAAALEERLEAEENLARALEQHRKLQPRRARHPQTKPRPDPKPVEKKYPKIKKEAGERIYGF